MQEPRAELRDEHGIELTDAERHGEEQREHDGRDRNAEVFQVFLLHGCGLAFSGGSAPGRGFRLYREKIRMLSS